MRHVLLGTTSLLLIGAFAAAQAQQAPAPAQPPPPATQAARAGTIEDVVITAQKRKERLQSATVSAQTLQPTVLQNNNVSNIADLSNIIPSVSIQGTTNGRVPYAMRGVTTTANESNVGLNSGVAVLLDGVSVPSDSHAADQIEDIVNIQVLKGPQATLGGRAAAAGVIDEITHSPTATWTGQASGTFTTDKEERGSFFASGPINDVLGMSIAGYGNETPYPIYNKYTGKYTTDTNRGVRAKLQYKPNADFTATLGLHFAQDHSYGTNFVYNYITPGSALLSFGLQPPFGPPGINFSVPGLMPGVTPHYGNTDANTIAQNTGAIITSRDATLNLDYNLGAADITSITAYQSESEKDIQDLFVVDQYFFTELTGGGAPFDNNQDVRNNVHQFSEEARIANSSTATLSYIAGVYYSDETVDSGTFRGLVPALVDTFVSPNTKTADLYGRLTYSITPKFSLTGGLRTNYDMLTYSYDQGAYAPSTLFPSNISSSGTYNANTVVGDITGKYQFNPQVMAYASYSRGYAPAAFNTASPLFNTTPLKPVAREDINDFELGEKGTYLDRTLLLNVNAFYTIYDNYQIETFPDITGLLNPPLILENAPKAQTHGVELDTTWRPTDQITLNFNAAYIDATFVDWKNAPCPGNLSIAGTPLAGCTEPADATPFQNVSGKTLPNSPKFKFYLDAAYDLPLPVLGGMDIVFDGNYAYRTSAQMLPDQNPHAVQGAYGLLNLSATAQFLDDKYSVKVFVNNLTNQVYYTDIEDFFDSVWSSPTGVEQSIQGQPGRDARRYAGFTLTARF
jgi:iron complex outermembrane receptor protein